MLKKTILLSGLIVFAVPNISCAPQGDECEECMHTSGGVVCVFCAVLCTMSAENTKQAAQNMFEKPQAAPQPGRIGQENSKKNL